MQVVSEFLHIATRDRQAAILDWVLEIEQNLVMRSKETTEGIRDRTVRVLL